MKQRLHSNSIKNPADGVKVKAIIDGLDQVASEMEKKWGVGRLRLLVNDDLRTRFDNQRRKLNDAIWDGSPADIDFEAARMKNAWTVLDKAAEENGAPPLQATVWEVLMPDGRVAALVRSNEEQYVASQDDRFVCVYTLEEIGRLIEGFPEIVKAKNLFPGAQVTDVRQNLPEEFWDRGDDLDGLSL